MFLFPWDTIQQPLNIFGISLSVDDLRRYIYYFYAYVLLLLYYASLYHLFEKKVNDEEIGWERAISSGLSRFGSVILTHYLTMLLLSVLTLMLIVPGILFGINFSFYFEAAVLRKCNLKAALKYSMDLVVSQWWDVFGIWLGLSLALWILPKIVYMRLFILLANLIPGSPILSVISYFVSTLITAFSIAGSLVFFLNLDYLHHLPTENTPPGPAPIPAGGDAELESHARPDSTGINPSLST